MLGAIYNVVAAATNAAIDANTVYLHVEETGADEGTVSVFLGSKFQTAIPFSGMDVDKTEALVKQLEKSLHKIL
jgi:hypothetical protein